jgi:hypothetical protein
LPDVDDSKPQELVGSVPERHYRRRGSNGETMLLAANDGDDPLDANGEARSAANGLPPALLLSAAGQEKRTHYAAQPAEPQELSAEVP